MTEILIPFLADPTTYSWINDFQRCPLSTPGESFTNGSRGFFSVATNDPRKRLAQPNPGSTGPDHAPL